MVIQNMPDSIPDRYKNIEYFRYELLIGIGHCEFRESMGGSTYPVAKSMSFSSMGEDEFNDMFTLCSNYILKHFLPGLDHATFNENLHLFMQIMKQQYEIQIGEITELTSGIKTPKQIIVITRDQFEVIETFASTRKDEDLNTIYKLNDCEFKVLPKFNI